MKLDDPKTDLQHGIQIQGLKPLHGMVTISGAKNSVLKLMAAAILTDMPCKIINVPDISDISYMANVLASIGFKTERPDNNSIVIQRDRDQTLNLDIPFELVDPFRAAINVLGPLLTRFGQAKVAIPGGDPIGARKLDIHVDGLTRMGATFELGTGYIEATANKLRGANIRLDFPSVGATENILMAAVLAEGETNILNAAREPEISDLANMLNKMGASIIGAGTSNIKITGVDHLNGASHEVIGDRIEAATYLIAAAVTGGSVDVIGVNPTHLNMVLKKLKEIGLSISTDENELLIRLKPSDKATLKGINLVTLPYPGFPTDVQAQMMVLLSIVNGESIITENVFENRFLFVHELKRMGADISIAGHYARIKGVRELHGCVVKATDIRGGAALATAGLAASGTTTITDKYHIERGYCSFVDKLRSLGADLPTDDLLVDQTKHQN